MRSAAIFLAVAGLAAAQTTTSTAATSSTSQTSGCGEAIDKIIDTCLGTENAMLSACAANDWDCLCTQSTNVLICYNNCPNDPNAFGASQTKTSYCNAAAAYGSSSSSLSTTASVSSALASAVASESSTIAAATTASAASATSGSGTSSTASSTGSAASASASGSGATHVVVPAGGALAVMFGLLCM